MTDPRGKFKSNWEGSYLAKKLFSKGAAILSDLEVNEFREPITMDKLKKYFLWSIAREKTSQGAAAKVKDYKSGKVKSHAGLKTSKRGGPSKSKGHTKEEREKENS